MEALRCSPPEPMPRFAFRVWITCSAHAFLEAAFRAWRSGRGE
jgi:hypothetical protein